MTFTASSNPIFADSEEVRSHQSNKGSVKEQFRTAGELFYSFYLMIDGSRLSFSTIRYLFDMYCANTDAAAQAMSAWLSSPLGLSMLILSSSSFIIFSLLANHLKEKHYLIVLWPYTRDVMKSLRNTYRAVQSTFSLICLLDIEDLRDFIVPASILLGIVAVLNRVWFRCVTSQRKEMMEENKKLLTEIQAAMELDERKSRVFINRIRRQSPQMTSQLLCSAILGGLIDGYIGGLILGALNPSALAVITIFCIIYLIATVTIRIYDEFKAQELLANQEKEIYLILFAKQNPTMGHTSPIEITPSPIIVSGLKNGMTGYKCIMLAISIILFLSPIKFKPVDPIYRAILGLSSLLIFLVHALISAWFNQEVCDEDKCENVKIPPEEQRSRPAEREKRSSVNRNAFFSSAQNDKEISHSICAPVF